MDTTFLEIFPVEADYSREHEEAEVSTVSTAADGSTRKVRYKGSATQTWALKFTDRTLAEYEAVRDFRRTHRLDQPFIYEETILGIRRVCYFDSGIKIEPNSYESVSFSCLVRAAAGIYQTVEGEDAGGSPVNSTI